MQTAKGVTAGTLGAFIFVLFLFVLHVPFLISLCGGIAVLIAVWLIWRNKPAAPLVMELDGASIDFYKKTIEEGAAHAKTIKGYLNKVDDPRVQEKIRRISEISDRIFEVLQNKPQSVKVIRQYFTYYLETTSKILAKYAELKRQRLRDAEVEEIMNRTESNLDLIADLFEQKLKNLVSDDVLDLDVELDMLQQMLKTEGIK